MTNHILAIESSGHFTRWLIANNQQILDSADIAEDRHHDTLLADGIDRLLREYSDIKIDAIAVVTGPGGYTGLRVGVAFTSALAISLGVPMIPISTFEAIAARAPGMTVWALVPLRRGSCRGRLMTGGPIPEALADAEDIVFKDLLGKMSGLLSSHISSDSNVLPLGEGYELHKAEIDEILGEHLSGKPDKLLTPVKALGNVAWEAFKQNRFIDPVEIDVDYGASFEPTLKL